MECSASKTVQEKRMLDGLGQTGFWINSLTGRVGGRRDGRKGITGAGRFGAGECHDES